VFVSRVVHGVVAGKLGADLEIPSGLVGHNLRFACDVGEDNGFQFGDGGSGDMERAGLSATLDEGQSDVSVATTATLDVFRFGRTFNPALYGFVNLDSSAATAEGRQAAIAHCFADAMGKKPSGF